VATLIGVDETPWGKKKQAGFAVTLVVGLIVYLVFSALAAGFVPILSPDVPRVVSHVIVPDGTELLLTQTFIDGYYVRLNVKADPG
jgi:hypothetical protein